MAKMARERAVKERRERKAEKKRAKKLAASAGEPFGTEAYSDVAGDRDLGTASEAESAPDIPVETPDETSA